MRELSVVEELLNTPADDSDIAFRESGFSQNVPYLEGVTVIRKLNEIYGPLGWQDSIRVAERLTVMKRDDGKFEAFCAMIVTLDVEFYEKQGEDDGVVRRKSHDGLGTGTSVAKTYGDAADNAMKTAATDALKRAFRKHGPTAGLDLYDKKYIEELKKRVGKDKGGSSGRQGKGTTQRTRTRTTSQSSETRDRAKGTSVERPVGGNSTSLPSGDNLGEMRDNSEKFAKGFFARLGHHKDAAKRYLVEVGFAGDNGVKTTIEHWPELPREQVRKIYTRTDGFKKLLEQEGFYEA